MSNILIINGVKVFAHSYGDLNNTLTNLAFQTLSEMGHQVQVTRVDDAYNIKDEIEKYLWADTVIYQMPGWWMGAPWTVKKYIDEIFTEGHGRLYASDGRSRSDASKQYGSGGVIQDKTYMLSLTWNAPLDAFNDPQQFFQGVGVDGVYLAFHKANQFLGMQQMPTFIANDVIKAPDVERYKREYQQHLQALFSEQVTVC